MKNKSDNIKIDSVSVASDIPTEMMSDVPSDVIIDSRIKYGTKTQMLKGLMMEYSKNSTFHGVRYIFERKRPLYERILWLILFLISVIISCKVIKQVHLKWMDSPVIVGFDETLIPIHRIPFPTVTICPESKMESNIFSFSNVYKRFTNGNGTMNDLSEEEINRFSASLQICDPEVSENIAKLLPKEIGPSILDTLRDMITSKNLTAPFCMWKNRFYFCENIFSLVATDDGICYQFNGMSTQDLYRNISYAPIIFDDIKVDFNKHVDRGIDDPVIEYYGSWSLDEGYVNQTEEAYPQRLLTGSARNAFVVLLQGLGHNLDYKCRSLRQGYKVYLSSPQNVVFSTTNHFLVRHNQEVVVQMFPVYISTSKGVRALKPERRKCFFNSERYLRFFKHYSQSNCEFECLTNFTISRCGCVKFSMPEPENMRVCWHSDIACYNEAEDELMKIQQHEILQSLKDPEFKSQCNCLPGCVSLSYDLKISQGRMNSLGTLQAYNETYDEHPDFLFSRVTLHFKEQQFTAIKRSELHTISTLIANYGGVLSLFIGFSILSIVELVYFLTIRLNNNLKSRERIRKFSTFEVK